MKLAQGPVLCPRYLTACIEIYSYRAHVDLPAVFLSTQFSQLGARSGFAVVSTHFPDGNIPGQTPAEPQEPRDSKNCEVYPQRHSEVTSSAHVNPSVAADSCLPSTWEVERGRRIRSSRPTWLREILPQQPMVFHDSDRNPKTSTV